MTLAQIQSRAASISMFSPGSAEDVRALAAAVGELAKRQAEFAQIVHDGVCVAAPALGVAISDWVEGQEEENTEVTNARDDKPTTPRA